ncbi:hypothetical protein [Streptomyces sp. 130]|uniref:hypothetical protein n=1 Tax=Streptomyces sp. 130 TaxID=2591006 RepID=UPI0021B12C25|nr:hypothetical protein [Streptomyces sp. 130]
MLPAVKPHVSNVLRQLYDQGLTDHVLIITRWRVDPDDCAVLNGFTNLRLTVLVTHSRIQDERIEPVDSSIAAASLPTLYENADRYRTVLYWRPIVPGLNDSGADIARAKELSRHAHATVFTGLFFPRGDRRVLRGPRSRDAVRGHRPAQDHARGRRTADSRRLRGGRFVGSTVP